MLYDIDVEVLKKYILLRMSMINQTLSYFFKLKLSKKLEKNIYNIS